MSNRMKKSAVVFALAGAIMLSPVPALASVPATVMPASESVVIDRSLHLEGASNARDIGGYLGDGGRSVRSGMVLRSNSLDKLTPADLAKLEDLNVTSVDDFRTVFERALAPDKIPAGATGNWFDVIGGNPANLPAMVSMPDLYRIMVTDTDAGKSFRNALINIETSDGAVMYHCTSGKDRTGWMTAVLLTILGVDRETVNADYMLSNQYLGGSGTGSSGPGSAFINSVEQSWLDISFATVDQQFGSFDNYVRQGLGLTDADIASLQAKLLN
ncbi:tyrosine-protein phosphatase [Rhodococcus sp. IEGM 1379]|uniref:tyrosine-protein phosphatase n=1 Tax=Rhodococcus sp. IEGM 1379 TaxID=3047086 RepID=UPI0024B73265|nr:tyrosine-protein phosphatase [Rhodococcus sp. IEGM 1379]MDI9916431.1 tyrosine-protein phosphatase [Rhodococcus sp. IEGM 1379]